MNNTITPSQAPAVQPDTVPVALQNVVALSAIREARVAEEEETISAASIAAIAEVQGADAAAAETHDFMDQQNMISGFMGGIEIASRPMGRGLKPESIGKYIGTSRETTRKHYSDMLSQVRLFITSIEKELKK
jgi:hypothetical protein